jgi:hypothetical protein
MVRGGTGSRQAPAQRTSCEARGRICRMSEMRGTAVWHQGCAEHLNAVTDGSSSRSSWAASFPLSLAAASSAALPNASKHTQHSLPVIRNTRSGKVDAIAAMAASADRCGAACGSAGGARPQSSTCSGRCGRGLCAAVILVNRRVFSRKERAN